MKHGCKRVDPNEDGMDTGVENDIAVDNYEIINDNKDVMINELKEELAKKDKIIEDQTALLKEVPYIKGMMDELNNARAKRTNEISEYKKNISDLESMNDELRKDLYVKSQKIDNRNWAILIFIACIIFVVLFF